MTGWTADCRRNKNIVAHASNIAVVTQLISKNFMKPQDKNILILILSTTIIVATKLSSAPELRETRAFCFGNIVFFLLSQSKIMLSKKMKTNVSTCV